MIEMPLKLGQSIMFIDPACELTAVIRGVEVALVSMLRNAIEWVVCLGWKGGSGLTGLLCREVQPAEL